MLQSDIYMRNLVAFVINEAHCVKNGKRNEVNLNIVNITLYLCRGDSFRKNFSQLGGIRSLIPSTVRVMALTATATKSSRRAIVHKLRMVSPTVISVSPNKPNIMYHVKLNSQPLEEVRMFSYCRGVTAEAERDGKGFDFC